jgi:hypothetical protein
MAIEFGSKAGATTANNTSASSAGGQNNEEYVSETTIGLGDQLFLMSTGLGSEYTLSLGNAIKEVYKNIPGQKPRVSILDRDSITNLAYSAIVISTKSNNTVNYFTVLLEATGRQPMKAAEIVSELNMPRAPGTRPTVYTIDDGYDKILTNIIEDTLTKEYGTVNMVPVDGMTVYRGAGDVMSVAGKVAALGYNATLIESMLANGEVRDLNIAQHRHAISNGAVRITSDMSRITLTDEVNSPVRGDFKVELGLIDPAGRSMSINAGASRKVLAKVSGFVDAIPEEIQVAAQPNQQAGIIVRLHPHIIITSDAVATPSPGYMLLGLIAGTVMINSNMWLACVTPHGKNDTGALNMYTNLDGSRSVLDLGSKKYTPEEMYSILTQMYSLPPIISMDVPSFGPQTFYTSILSTAASPEVGRPKEAALRRLVQIAVRLTDGAFPSDFPINEIFVNYGIVIPCGVWADKNGERDIRDIDMAFIASQTRDAGLMNQWAQSALPREMTGRDPFVLKTEVIARILPDAEIRGKAIRVTFTSKFISTLISAMRSAGLEPRYEPAVLFNEQSSIANLGSYFSQGAMGNIAGFQRYTQNNGNAWSSNYSYMGSGRY